ncbi:transcriptional regulator/antitoxin MazE [Caballeronia arvi]|uniref:Transcriptional regulator/antitoxin MazE n=1 Tax=Caballeronia arvi TaxID=1777135 RepID=A0A158JQY9_9BURK|nr:PbsX family transcriptional regulator [Caballeronia arvi]SAL71198.1 transcriptional regulator/antitoxin MazE [Caballeronia arvi]
MKIFVQSFEDHVVLCLPQSLLEKARLQIGDALIVDVRPEGILLRPTRPKYSLEELIAKCDLHAPAPDGVDEWINVGTIGHELSLAR